MSYSEAPFKPARRDSRMPRLFKVTNHPLLKNVPSDLLGQVYVGLMATDAKSMTDAKVFEKKMKCPTGGAQDWVARGLVQLRPGDYLFLRDPLVSKKPKDNVLAVMVTGAQHHDTTERAQFDKATMNMLRPRTKRSASSTAFEDTHCVRKIRGKRCYSLGTAVQMHRRIVAPSASLDQHRPNINRYQTMVKDLIDSTASMMVNVQDALPAECKKAFAANSELTGQPSIGKDKIYGTGSVQLNISAAGLFPGDTRLGNQLGDFGCEHFDKNDSPDHLTTMFANPDVPKEYKSGAFHILQLGVFIVLDKYVGVTFSGRRLHVGTAPTPPPGCPAVPHAYRFNVVWYPKDASVDGQSRFTLASMPGKRCASSSSKKPQKPRKEKQGKAGKGKGKGGKSAGKKQPKSADGPFPLYITPEMINMANEGFVPFTTNEATFARSGHIIMDREAHVNFVARALSQLETYVWRQLPSSYEIEIDRSKPRPDVSYRSEARGGGRVRLKPWTSGPNVNAVSDIRKQNLIIWAAYQQKVRRFLPHLAGGRTTSAKAGGHAGGCEDGSPEETSEADDNSEWEDDSDEEGFQLEVPEDDTQGPECVEGPVRGMSQSASNGGGSVQSFGHQSPRHDDANGEVGGACNDGVEGDSGPMEGGDNPEGVRNVSDPEDLGSKPVQQGVAASRTAPFNLADEHDDTSDEEEVEALCQADILLAPPPATLTTEAMNSNLPAPVNGKRLHAELANTLEDDEPDAPTTKRPRLLEGLSSQSLEPQSELRLTSIHANAPTALPTMSSASPLEDQLQLQVAKHPSVPVSSPASSLPTVNRMVFPFLQGLTQAVLELETRDIYEEFSRVLGDQGDLTALEHSTFMASYQSFLSRPFSQAAPIHIRTLLQQIRGYPITAAKKAVVARFERYSILLSSIHVWYWMDVTVRDVVKSIFSDPLVNGHNWLATAVKIAKDGLKDRRAEIVFDPQIHAQLMNLQSRPVSVSNRARRMYLQGNPADDALHLEGTVQTIQKLLMQALGFDGGNDMKERRRAWIMGTLASVLGIDFLATHYAWNAWLSFTPKDYFESGNGRTERKFDSTFVTPFENALRAHPICQEGSSENAAYILFRKRLRDRSQYSSMMLQEPQPEQSQYRRLDGFLRRSLSYLAGRLSPEHAFHQYLQANPDFRNPFREQAPSRLRFRGSGGPYMGQVIRTPEGLFSAVVYRGITYNTPFSMHPDSPLLFEGITDWDTKLEEHRSKHPESVQDRHYFCKPNAYGQSIVGREVGKAKVYWDEVKALNWPERLKAAGGAMSFSECFSTFKNAKFPSMGNLCLFLLAGDLHYAGICNAPTASDVASFIHAHGPLKSGSYKALNSLGLIGSNASRVEIEHALLAVQTHLETTFTEDERKAMGLDLICVEHLLCKFTRADAAGLAD